MSRIIEYSTLTIYNKSYEEVLPTIESGSVALALCDLPYNTTDAKRERDIDLEALFKELWRILKPDGVAVFFATFPFSEKVYNADPKNFRYKWYWHKTQPTGFANAKKQPLRDIEEILVFYKKAGRYFPIDLEPCFVKGRKKTPSDLYSKGRLDNHYIRTQKNYPRSLLTYKKQRNKINPTAKPIDLLEYIIKTYTERGEIVLDPTFGSGNTGIACAHTARAFIGCEIDKDQYLQALKRITEAEGGGTNERE